MTAESKEKKTRGVVVVLFTLPAAVLVLVYSVWQYNSMNSRANTALSEISIKYQSDHSQNIISATSEPFVLDYGNTNVKTFVAIPANILVSWTETYFRPWTGKTEYRLKRESIESYLQEMAPSVNTAPENARFSFNQEIKTIYESTSPQFGTRLDITNSAREIMRAMSRGLHGAGLVLESVSAKITLESITAMGINARLSDGVSDFGGSPNFRVHNIKVGARRFNDVIIAVGEEFSFNDWLGEVEAATGYLPELVIKGNKIIPEYGGGLCQVATTFFRSIMEAGLPILERHNHSLPVRYYNPQGYDATIYPGVSDLRFKNDTSAPMLVQSRIEGTKIYFSFYGRDDGRVVKIEGPYQYDAKPDGSLKAVVHQVVTSADGVMNKKSFYSSYKSPGLFQTIRNPLE